MDAIQMSHHKMHEACLGVLDSNNTIWQGNTALTGARNQLSAGIDLVISLQQTQGNVTVGVTEDKTTLRRQLAEKAVFVGGAVAAYADGQSDHDLFAKVDFTVSDLIHGAEEACETNCSNILKAAQDNAAALIANQSLTQADIDGFATMVDGFGEAISAPRQAKAGTKAATNQLPTALLANDRTLERQVDRLMEKYRTSNADFFQAYETARVIQDPATHLTKAQRQAKAAKIAAQVVAQSKTPPAQPSV